MKSNSTTMTIRDKVFHELQYDALSAIVTEALVRAVPLNKAELATSENMRNLKDYVGVSLRNMGAVQMIDQALENATDISKKAYLYTLKDAISEVPMEAAVRIANENVNGASVQQTVTDRAFTKEELNKLQTKADSLTIPELSRVINKKVTGVLKDEKDAYEKEQILQHELSKVVRQHTEDVQDTLAALDEPEEPEDDELDNTTEQPVATESDDEEPDDDDDDDLDDDMDEDDDEDDESLDSFMNVALTKSDVRHHVSIFSKLQDMAIESIMTSGYHIDSELPMGVLREITDNSVFTMPNIAEESVDSQIDRLTAAMEEITPTALNDDTMKTALTCAIMVYTMLETLKTMNISTPALDNVKNFVTGAPRVTTPEQVSNALQEKLQQQVVSIRDKIPTMNQGQVGIAFDSCTNLRTQINELTPKYPAIKEKVGPVLEGVIATLQAKMNGFNKSPAEESTFTRRQRSSNAAEFSRLANLWGSRTDVREFKISVDPASEGTLVNVEIKGNGNTPIATAGVNLQRSQLDGNLLEIVTEAVSISRLVDSFPAISIYNTKTCRSTPIKSYTY